MRSNYFKFGRGFTLVELMVAITILSLLAVMGMSAFSGSFARARDSKAAADVRAISQALELYHTINHEYPADLGMLVNEPGAEDRYLRSGSLPLDKATDRKYMYHFDADKGFCVCTYLFEHASGAGSNAVLSVDDAAFGSASGTCSQMEVKEVGEGDHFCMTAAQ